MAKRNVIISFDYENDGYYKNLLKAWDANSDFQFTFSDLTPNEIQSWDISRIKAVLTTKINQATYTLVIIGKYANTKHEDADEIGYRNWINYEIAKSVESGNKIVAVKIDKSYNSPEEIYGSGASWAMSFTQDAIIKALDEA